MTSYTTDFAKRTFLGEHTDTEIAENRDLLRHLLKHVPASNPHAEGSPFTRLNYLLGGVSRGLFVHVHVGDQVYATVRINTRYIQASEIDLIVETLSKMGQVQGLDEFQVVLAESNLPLTFNSVTAEGSGTWLTQPRPVKDILKALI